MEVLFFSVNFILAFENMTLILYLFFQQFTMSVTRINRGIIATALVGILVSTYALYVEMAAEARPGYTALCDLSEHASCTRVLTSELVLPQMIQYYISTLTQAKCRLLSVPVS